MGEQNVQKLPAREEIDPRYKWKLEDIYPSIEAWEKDYEAVKQQLPDILEYRGKIGESAQNLLHVLQADDRISETFERLYAFAAMRKDEDTTNETYQALVDRVTRLSVEVQGALSFITPEILKIPQKTIDRYLEENRDLQLYRHALNELLRQKEHVLSPEQEKLLAEAGEIAQGPSQIFGMLNDADIEFPTIKDENGEDVELTKGNYIQFLENPNREVRERAFHAFYDTYAKQKNTLTAIFANSIKKDVFFARARNYRSSREAALKSNNIPLEVYDNLLETVSENLEPLHRYVSMRKKALGLDELHMYDLYVPIVQDVDVKIPYEEAVKTVEEGLQPLGAEYIRKLREGLHSGWIDVYENKGKRGGAYSFGVYGVHPFILLNHKDNLNHLFTLAHEMGHAMHSYLTQEHQPYVYGHYTIFVAEVASTVNEVLLMKHLLKTTEDETFKKYLLNHYMEQFRQTVYRQTMFAEFEKRVHEKAEAGEALTADSLSGLYHDLNVKYYGDDIVVDSKIALEWARVPHFYRKFYVYQYATGFSAAVAIAEKILREGEPAVQNYLDFLSSGNSDTSIELLKKAGVDMTSPEPVAQALKVFDQTVRELETLL